MSDEIVHARKQMPPRGIGRQLEACGLRFAMIADSDTEVPGVGSGIDFAISLAGDNAMIHFRQIHYHETREGAGEWEIIFHVHPNPYSPPRPPAPEDKSYTLILLPGQEAIDYALAPLENPEILQLILMARDLSDVLAGLDGKALKGIAAQFRAYYDGEVAQGAVREFPLAA